MSFKEACAVVERWLGLRRHVLDLPGLSAAIRYGNRLHTVTVGSAGDAPMTEETTFRVASHSKVFTAVAILQLVERGKLGLDDNIDEHLPWASIPDVTIRHVLTHTAGLQREGGSTHWMTDDFPDQEDLKGLAENGLSSHEPLEAFKYSNLGFALLGQLLEHVTGTSYQRYVQKHIIQPLGLENTTPRRTDEQLATGFSRPDQSGNRHSFEAQKTASFAPAAGVTSTPTDLTRFFHEVVHGDLLDDIMWKEMRRIQWDADPDWGLSLMRWDVDGEQLYGHTGALSGYVSATGAHPEQELVVSVITNAINAKMTPLMHGTADAILTILDEYEQFAADTKPDSFDPHRGTYSSRWDILGVEPVHDRLLGFSAYSDDPMHQPYEMVHRDGDTFELVDGSPYSPLYETVVFDTDDGRAQQVRIGDYILHRGRDTVV